jgi:hypothetical protein
LIYSVLTTFRGFKSPGSINKRVLWRGLNPRYKTVPATCDLRPATCLICPPCPPCPPCSPCPPSPTPPIRYHKYWCKKIPADEQQNTQYPISS